MSTHEKERTEIHSLRDKSGQSKIVIVQKKFVEIEKNEKIFFSKYVQ